jgi:CheY-like chemotaxis protein
MTLQKTEPKKIFLADDDSDDCLLFEEALREVCTESSLTTANDGIELMKILESEHLPDLIFLDLNMPRKNGFECLSEIRQQSIFNHIPIIIFSTTAQPEAVHNVYENGANYFVCKPNTFQLLKNTIHHVLAINWPEKYLQIYNDKVVFSP